jgi:rod shape-determining protein MreD
MARPVFAVLVLVAALVQATVLPALVPFGVMPNLVLVLLLVWVALRGVVEGLLWVLGAGLLLDALAMDALGTNGLALLPVVLAAGLARRRFFHSSMIVPLALAVVATIAHGLILTVLRGLEAGWAMPPLAAVLQLTFLQALLNAVLVPPLYLVASRINRWEPERV